MAAFANRSALLTFIAADCHRSDLTSALPTFCALTEADINAKLRARPMMERWTTTITAEFVDLPTDFGGLRTMRLTNGTRRRIKYITPDQMADLKGAESTASTGEPEYVTILGDEFEFYPDPTGGTYNATSTGWLRVPELTESGATSTNWLLAKHPSVYVAGIKRYVYGRARNAIERALAKSDFDEQIALLDRSALMESYADDLTPSAGMVV